VFAAPAVEDCGRQDDQPLRDQPAGLVDAKDGHHDEQQGKGQHTEERAPDAARPSSRSARQGSHP
jgi:hypothetical protein